MVEKKSLFDRSYLFLYIKVDVCQFRPLYFPFLPIHCLYNLQHFDHILCIYDIVIQHLHSIKLK